MTAVLVACGGGSDKGGGAKDETAAFVHQADTLCLDGARITTVEVPLQLGAQRDFAKETEATVRYQEALRSINGQLRGLRPSANLAAGYGKFISAREQTAVARDEVIAARRSGDRARITAAYKTLNQLDNAAFTQAAKTGLNGCDFTLPARDEAAVKKVVTEVESSRDGTRVCEELLYPGALKNLYPKGGREECFAFQSDPRNGSTPRFTAIGGFEGVSANVAFLAIGGRDNGKRFTTQLFFDKSTGTWRIWSSAPAS